MKRIFGLLITGIVCGGLLSSVFVSGCGHHRAKLVIDSTVTVVDSSTHSEVPSNTTIVLQQPSLLDQAELIRDLLAQLKEFHENEQPINITVEVENNVDVDTSVDVDVEGDRIIVRPGKQRKLPKLYHWLKKLKKKHCKRARCSEGPKPCNNEDDD